MKITFLGATHEVTGSCTLVEVGGKYILVDCGIEQGKDFFENQDIPVEASQLSAVLLTHAHVDHSGKLPLLYKNGFRGPIYTTTPTMSLCHIMLMDCAHIQESDAEYATRKAQRAGLPPVEPLYTIDDAKGAIDQLRAVPYGQTRTIEEGVTIRFNDVGHLLGSAAIEMWLSEGGQERKLIFSGDVGNVNQPLLKDPQRVEGADYVMIESTYGDRVHAQEQPDYVAELTKILQRTFDRGGNVVIPSFAVGRTQQMLYFLREIKNAGLVKGHDGFKVYVDSPMANEATAVFLQTDKLVFDEDTVRVMNEGANPLWFDGLTLSTTVEESRAINAATEPCVILAASGMCEGGRIRHHLKHNLWREESTILFVGFQSPGTLGRVLYDGAKSVKLFNESITVRAEITSIAGMSGHADKNGLLAWLKMQQPAPKMVFVNHGEDAVTESFATLVKDELGCDADAPYSGTSYDLLTGDVLTETTGIPIVKKPKAKAKPMPGPLYDKLKAALSKLSAIVDASAHMEAGDLKKFTGQISDVVDRWKK